MESNMAHTTLSRIVLGIFTLVLADSLPPGEAWTADYQPGTPSTYLFDTGSPSPTPWDARQMAAKSGWTVVPEEKLTHSFRGDVVLLNDRLIIALRGGVTEVYCETESGPKHRTTLSPLAASGNQPESMQTVRILENNPGAVMLAASYKLARGGVSELQIRLTAGQLIAELQPGDGVDRLLVLCPARYVIVPDFFGDDMVFGPGALTRSRLRLPAENFCLGLADRGTAEVMCVWQSSQQQAVAVRATAGGVKKDPNERSSPDAAAFAGWEIQAVPDKKVWLACLEGEDLWHERALAADEARGVTTLDWKPPFAAKWRADLLAGQAAAESWFFDDPEASKEDQAVASAASARHTCCLDAGRAQVRWSGERLAAERASLLLYALDRNRQTPLARFCPVDVLRNTLGVGPCEYILQTEGLATETNPTPNNVMTWVEKQFGRNRQKKAADEIQELLDQMVLHVGRAQARVERYGKFAKEVDERCGHTAASRPGDAELAALQSIAQRIERDVAAFSGKAPPPAERARQLAAQVVALIDRADSLAECEKLGAELRAIGASEDRMLAKCRMASRWLKESAAMLAEDAPAQAAVAREVRDRVQQVLESK